LIETALSFEGVRYRYRGSDRNGMDCSGLVAVSFAAIDVKVPRTAADLYGAGSRIRRDDLIAGDLVFFSNTAGPGITHVGIYLGDGWFIHSSSSKGVIRSRLDDEYYVKHYAGGRSLLGR
jgi:cell wall-associated NlpC family hydrolase